MEFVGFHTTKGLALSAKLLTGTALNITRVTAGAGETAPEAVVLAQEHQTLAVAAPRRDGTTVTLPVTLLAAQAEEDYALREVGIYARDPEEGEILYRVYRLDQPVDIAAGGQLVARMDLRETVGLATVVAVQTTAAGLLTQGDLDALLSEPDGIATLDSSGIVPVSQMPYTYGTTDLTAGTSPLETGKLYFVYE